MGGKNQAKTRNSEIVGNIKPMNTRAGKKRKAQEAAAGGSNPENVVVAEASRSDGQVNRGDVEDGVIDVSQRSVNQADSENPKEAMKMMTEDGTVGNEGAPTTGIPGGISGHTNEVDVHMLSRISSDPGVENASAGVGETQHDGETVERGRPAGHTNEAGAEMLGAISYVTEAVEDVSTQVEESQRDLEKVVRSSGKEVGERVTKLEGSIKYLRAEMLQAISDAVTAVKASLQERSAENTVVYMGQPGPSYDETGAPRAHCSTKMTTEAPTEYCNVTYNDEIYRLLFTYQESTIITAATTLREFIRKILCKYHTIPELQRFTLRGIGANREPRPMLNAWLVELIIKAAETWRPFPPVPVDERPDGPLNSAKKTHDANLSAKVRRLISDILQYYRETRDPEGNMRRRQPRGDVAEDEQQEDREHPGEDDDEEQDE